MVVALNREESFWWKSGGKKLLYPGKILGDSLGVCEFILYYDKQKGKFLEVIEFHERISLNKSIRIMKNDIRRERQY